MPEICFKINNLVTRTHIIPSRKLSFFRLDFSLKHFLPVKKSSIKKYRFRYTRRILNTPELQKTFPNSHLSRFSNNLFLNNYKQDIFHEFLSCQILTFGEITDGKVIGFVLWLGIVIAQKSKICYSL